jgi:hypothetical protein
VGAGSSLLRLDPGLDPSLTAIQRTVLQLSADALVSSDDLRLAPVTAPSGSGASFTAYQTEDLSAAAVAERLGASRWLLLSSGGSGASASRHTAFYRPVLQSGTSNRISGLALPEAVIAASGDRQLELTVLEEGVPAKVLLRQRGTARVLSELLTAFALNPTAPGPLRLQLELQETLDGAGLGSVLPGSLRLFEQQLLFQVSTSAVAAPVAPTPNLSAPAGALSFQEGRGLLLLEDLSYADAVAALATAESGGAIQLQLQILGYEGTEASPYSSGLLSLADLGLIPAANARDGGNTMLEAIRAAQPGAHPLQLQRIELPVGSGSMRRLVGAWVLRPDLDLQGSLPLQFNYANGRGQSSVTLPLLVLNTPDAPRRVPGQESSLRLLLETGPRPGVSPELIDLRSLVVDPDGTPLVFSLEGAPPPAGISFDAATASLSIGSLPHSAIGTHRITVVASEGNPDTAVSLTFEITVRERNLPPVWNLPTTLQADGSQPAQWDPQAQRWLLDVNGDALSFRLANGGVGTLPAGIRLEGGRLVVEPSTPAGTYSLRLGASDGP